MCGITGYAFASPDRPADVERLRAMVDTLRHRGPDGEGALVDAGIALGIRRLSIIDLETGDQPIANEDRSVHVVCNGEIYNYVELRRELIARGHRFRTHSDVEVIAHLYEEDGPECVHSLRGMFAIAIWDATARTLLLARDRFGIKPLYYTSTSDGLFFGSEQKAILASGAVDREIDPRGLHDLLTFGFVVAPSTMLRGIRQLEPGTTLTYCEGHPTVRTYWDARFPARGEEERRSDAEWIERFRAELEETVRLHLRSDVPVGAWLSAGVDSSAIVALMAAGREDAIHTTTLAFENESFDEVRGQRTLLDDPHLNLARHVAWCGDGDFARFPETTWYTEDPTATGLEVPRSILGAEAASGVKVILTGEGADELLAGYPRFRLDKLLRPLAVLPPGIRRLALLGDVLPKRYRRASRMLVAPRQTRLPRYIATLGGPSPEGMARVLTPDAQEMLRSPETVWDLEVPSGFDRWSTLAQMQYYEIKIRLPSFVIHTLDRGSMAHSLEARVPFLDHKLFELTAQMPPRLKLRGFREKHVLRESVRDLLPSEIVTRRKRGMQSPIAEWLRAPLPAGVCEMFGPESLRGVGLFEPSGVSSLLREHRDGIRNGSTELMAVLALQSWHRVFIQGETRSLE